MKRVRQLRQVAGDAQIAGVERRKRSHGGHVGDLAVLPDRRQSPSRSKADRIRAASARSCGLTVSLFIR
jgi:hypothetical protein